MEKKFKFIISCVAIISVMLCTAGCYKASDKGEPEYEVELFNPNFLSSGIISGTSSSDTSSSHSGLSSQSSSHMVSDSVSSKESGDTSSLANSVNTESNSSTSRIENGCYKISADEDLNPSDFDSMIEVSAIIVDENNKKFSSIDGILYSKDKKTLIKCPRGYMGEVNIPDGVEVIHSQSFYCCDNITEITIPNSVKEIGDNAFYRCSSLKRVYMPKNVELIGVNIFDRCNSLKDIVKR